ncbi:unnamed protein product [Hymenolepis diminuta]|uniref:HECT-type E3 ubiquitin transferase n=1 Tax=Hymenolepis diminuta TaxID=6216 RepID=A0A0R3SHQ2_HYMDI|nr:unnamed protein product [Hymenolepis diminuta]
MHSFEGRFKSRRQPPYIPEQTNIVQKMQEERRVRAQNARLEKAAITIQCFYRGYKTRRMAKDILDKHFLQLSDVFLALSTDASSDPCLEKSMQSCLSSFLLCCRSGSSNFLMMARVLLTPTCKSIFIQSIQRGYSSLLATIKQTIIYFLSYLKSLPPLSSTDQYSIIIEVLDAYLFRSRSRQYSQSIPGAESDKFFLDVCKRGRYFSSLTVFIDRQSHFPDEFSSSALDEYIRMPNNRNFVYLIRTPFSLCSSKQGSSDVSPLQEIVSMAVKDIADVDEQNRSTDSSRFLRFIFPLIGSSIPFETLVNYLYACAGGETEAVQSIPENEYSKPSLNLLMVFLSGPIQGYLREKRLGSGSNDDHEVLLRVLRILAWMFSALIAARCPADGSTAVFSPPFPPEPLDGPHSTQTRFTKHSTILVDSVYADNDSDSSVAEADNDDINMLHSGRDFEQTPLPAEIVRFTDSVPGQTKEVFNLLEKILPLIGREVLQGVCISHSNNSKDEGVQEVLNSIPILYAMLAFYRSTPPTSLRLLTSSVSEPPQFIHDLWQLVTTIRGDNKVETIFDSIVNKTILDTPRNMDLFTSALLTFLASLHYRLYQLTDEEVDANPRPPENINSYGFTPNCLLSVGLRLRDFLLGVIDLLYPDRPPLRAKPDGSYAPVTLGDVIARVERQRMSDRSTTSPNKERADEKARLIWCLHRWRSVFLATQQVIRLIYAWRRRRRRLQFEDWAIATSDPSNQETEPGIEWLCPSSMSSELAEARTAEWILRFCDDLKSRESTGAELGYFSCLNPDAGTEDFFVIFLLEIILPVFCGFIYLADDTPMTSGAYIYWRKWTLIFELPFIFPFWDRVKVIVFISICLGKVYPHY